MPGPNYEMPKDVVPPGDQTGIYYIPISNLPFNISWQQIKDHVRQVCEVDHVEIFQKSTCGWVRVKGRENFEAAYRHLDGQELGGRSLCADSRNGSGPILVRDLLLCKPSVAKPGCSKNHPPSGGGGGPAPDGSPLYAQGGPVSYPDASILSSSTSTGSSSFSQTRVDGYNNIPSFSQPTMMHGYDGVAGGFARPAPLANYGYGHGQPFLGYPTSHPDSSQSMMYPTPISYAVQPPDYYAPVSSNFTHQMAAMSLGSGHATTAPAPPGVIYTEQRGIQIRNVSQRASREQVQKMVVHATGGPDAACLIHSIEVPVDKDGNSRRLAFVHYHSASVAHRMAQQLDGVEFMGRKLQVRLMKDADAIYGGGASAASSSSLAGRGGPSAAKASRSNAHKKSSYSASSSSSSSRKDDKNKRKDKALPSKKSSHSTPLVVGGSVATSSSSSSTSSSAAFSSKDHKGKGKGKDAEWDSHNNGKKASGVVIADGSFGRSLSDSEKRR